MCVRVGLDPEVDLSQFQLAASEHNNKQRTKMGKPAELETTPAVVSMEQPPPENLLHARVEDFLKCHFSVQWEKNAADAAEINNKDKAQRRKFQRVAEKRRTPDAIDKAGNFWQSCALHFRATQLEAMLRRSSNQGFGCQSMDSVDLLMSRIHSKDAQEVFKASDFLLLEKIGSGGYGSVYKAVHVATGHIVALKQLDRDSSKVETQGQLMLPLDCGVVPCYGTFHAVAPVEKNDNENIPLLQSELKLWMILKLCGASLKDRLVEQGGPLPKKEAAFILRKVAKTLSYLYQTHSIVHHDIKPANILFDTDGSVLLCDLGVARKGKWQKERIGGTYSHMSPEKIRARKQYSAKDRCCSDEKIDVWALGVMLYEMSFFAHPFIGYKAVAKCPTVRFRDAKDTTELSELMQCYNYLSLPEQPCSNTDLDDGQILLKDILQSMLNPNPAERLNLASIKEHPWMKRHGKWSDRAILKLQTGLQSGLLAMSNHNVILAMQKQDHGKGDEAKLNTRRTSATARTVTIRRFSFPSTPSEMRMSNSC
ncbi:TRAF2 and NCK-interacting protein kinase [Seminavis robusta]|uniref:mitogen-activated protein kinase kinase n=1 Tax=Seminavis robusta TaxID=568900 RepID=A0A9N8DLH9_9STRA|nr:TRAF2 and NCK-interacting protein kinase [Seminavis robusta]|eukprot:Sro145_g067180.1 TRAF2 and NCK-interacting protein kinase (538) ;mRNA; f:8326-9939